MKHNNYNAFTLVELIVVITILAVLATVAFISFQGYTSSSRDSVRLADLKNISKSFELNRTKGIDFPLPDKKVDISSSGTIFQYQGELSPNILQKNLNIFDGGLDPLTGDSYGYAVNTAKNKYQIIGFLENSQNLANISFNKTFADNTDKYVKSGGDTLGILLDESTNNLITLDDGDSEIDLDTISQNYGIIFDGEINIGGAAYLNEVLSFRIHDVSSCKAILLNGDSQGNGMYTINPSGIQGEEFRVYCDMNTDGGGWTGVLNFDDTFRNYSSLGDDNCDVSTSNCLSKSWSSVNLTQILIEGKDGDIIGNNFDTQAIFDGAKKDANYINPLKYFMDNDGTTDCGYNQGWGFGEPTKVLKTVEESTMGNDYRMFTRKGKVLCINDHYNVENGRFILGIAGTTNSAGWPEHVFDKHWHTNYRIYVR